MNENKTISLGTIICLFIILILTLIIFGMWYYYNHIDGDSIDTSNNMVKDDISLKNEFVTLSIDTANKKNVDDDRGYTIKKSDIYGLHLYIIDGKVYFTSDKDAEDWVRFMIVSDENEVKVSKNRQVEITGFNQKVVDAEISCASHAIGASYFVFLMEDGTVEYSSIKNMITNISTEGKVSNVSNIQRIYNCSVYSKGGVGGHSSVVALDYENNFYDIGDIIYNKIIVDDSNLYGI